MTLIFFLRFLKKLLFFHYLCIENESVDDEQNKNTDRERKTTLENVWFRTEKINQHRIEINDILFFLPPIVVHCILIFQSR